MAGALGLGGRFPRALADLAWGCRHTRLAWLLPDTFLGRTCRLQVLLAANRDGGGASNCSLMRGACRRQDPGRVRWHAITSDDRAQPVRTAGNEGCSHSVASPPPATHLSAQRADSIRALPDATRRCNDQMDVHHRCSPGPGMLAWPVSLAAPCKKRPRIEQALCAACSGCMRCLSLACSSRGLAGFQASVGACILPPTGTRKVLPW